MAEGYLTDEEIPETDGYKPPTSEFIDGLTYDGRNPVGYINSFNIGNKEAIQ
jgi:nitrate/nitrite transport system substrate-binding protein